MSTIDINTPIQFENPVENSSDEFNNYSSSLDLQKNFLTLLMAQIQNQDPIDPIKNTDITLQLAQINTASGIAYLNDNIEKISNKINNNQKIQLNSLIGRRVMTPSNNIFHTENTETKFGVELIDEATCIEIKILDDNKNVLYDKKIIENKKPGIYHFSWNGQDLAHHAMPTGKYKISVKATQKDQNVRINSLIESKVDSIITSFANPIFNLGLAGKINLLDIREILT